MDHDASLLCDVLATMDNFAVLFIFLYNLGT